MNPEKALLLRNTKDVSIADQVRTLNESWGPFDVIFEEYLPEDMAILYFPTLMQRGVLIANRDWAVKNFMKSEQVN